MVLNLERMRMSCIASKNKVKFVKLEELLYQNVIELAYVKMKLIKSN